MVNQELSEIFQHIAEILEFHGDPNDTFRIRAYINASMAIKELPESLEDYVKEKKLRTIPGIGEGISKKIEEYVKTGKIREYEILKRSVDKGIFELMEISSLGPKKVKILATKLGVTSIPALKKAVTSGKIEKLAGFGKRSAEKILEGITMKEEQKGRMLFGSVYLTVQNLVSKLKQIPEVKEAVPAGSFRRSEETVGDIDILVTTRSKRSKKIMDAFTSFPEVTHILAKGDTKSSVIIGKHVSPELHPSVKRKALKKGSAASTKHGGIQVDVRVVSPNQFGSALQYFTGSKKHNIHLRTLAKARGFKLSEYGFFRHGKLAASKSEEECYKSLGMQYIPPELRTDTGEIEAALKGKIPKDLIEYKDLKGDLHTHSTWSDGGNSIEEMALAAAERGYEYIAMTDHSPALPVAGGMKIPELKKKKKEIDRLNEKFAKSKRPIRILFGTEVDIKADGSIDYPDEVLKEFDVVVASIHSRFGKDNTDRILKAMENPYVHIIGHVSGRLIGERNPYPLDYEKIFKKAADTGKVLEINSQYLRLDLQDVYMREAKRWGVKFSINSDAHSTQGLWMSELGCSWARRGWITREEVINTMSLTKLSKILHMSHGS